MQKARDIMEKNPYICREDATIGDVIKQLFDSQISGVPIVDGRNKILGYVTDVDLMRYVTHEKPKVFSWGDMTPVIIDDEPISEKMRDILSVPALSIANKKRHYVDADLELDEVADLFENERVLKMAVIENDQVVGVVSRSAVLRQLLANILPE
ncbi:MAG: CBS domain-containing protein [Clostridiales Family XIII bacterium]|jgi:CBS domain-containing protein|nr:CBS domain-containing protein [Clostridiales Family XIII bacterium]